MAIPLEGEGTGAGAGDLMTLAAEVGTSVTSVGALTTLAEVEVEVGIGAGVAETGAEAGVQTISPWILLLCNITITWMQVCRYVGACSI